MKAILLAAGVGQRLGTVASNKPKCLLEFGGSTLLERHFKILDFYGIEETLIVSGYQSEQLENNVNRTPYAKHARIVINRDFEKGSHISLLRGLLALDAKEDFILMDADVLYDHRMIRRLLDTSQHNCFLLDQDFIPGDEPVKLCIKNGRIIEFRKKIEPGLVYDMQGESVGFFRFSPEVASELIKVAEEYLESGKDQTPYEECIRDLLLDGPERFGYEDVTDLKWIEIDFPEDIERADNEILPGIQEVD